MTITQDPSAILVAVVGATGRQGGSVVKALAESDRPYRIRAFTRNKAKPEARALAERGVAIVELSLVLENKEKVMNAFEGADYVFLVTDFWVHLDVQRETAEGKLFIDAAKAAGVKGIIWSGLPLVSKLTKGKYQHVYHFDGKGLVTEYGRNSGVPFVNIQTGYYASNFFGGPMGLIKQADGSFVISWPMKPTTMVPVVDIVNDYGLYVRYALEAPEFPDGADIITYGENMSIAEYAAQLAKGTGKDIAFQEISSSEFEARLKAANMPPVIVEDMVAFTQYWSEFGVFPEETITPIEGLARRPRTWAEYVEVTDWSSIFA